MLCRANFSTQRPHGRAAISAALRMLCRANSSTHRPPGRTLHKKRMPHLRVTSFFLFSYSSVRCRHGVRTGGRPYLLPSGRSAVPISTPSPHQHGCAAGASRFGRGARPARFCLFAAARRCAGCLSWCAAPAFCSRRPCCRSAGQRALLQSGCRSGTACRAAPSCRQRTAG